MPSDAGSPRTRRSLLAAIGAAPLASLVGSAAADRSTGAHVPFAVRDAASGEVVHEGTLSAPVEDRIAGQTLAYADCTPVDSPGRYVVEAGGATSHPFDVDDGVYDRVLAEACRVYTCKRSGTAIEDPLTGLSMAAGHEGDETAALYFSDDYHDQGEAIDVSGGWYDAGDYGKYVPTGAVTVGELLHAYEDAPEAFAEGQLSLPEGHGEAGTPDLLAEVRFELEWLARMQRPDGAVYFKVAGEDWPPMVAPAEDDEDRYVFGLSTYGTATTAAAMALAARVYEPYDAAFADRALAVAEDAWDWLREHPEPQFRQDEGQDGGSGGYRPGDLQRADDRSRFWAAAELLATTGDDAYDAHLASELEHLFRAEPTGASWGDPLVLGQWAYHGADAAESSRREAVAAAILASADGFVSRADADGYDCALRANEYVWASAKIALSRATLLLLAHEIDPDPAYEAAALDQLHAVLGRSATGYSYVTHAGTRYPRNPHDRVVESQGVLLPGMVVGGPNAGETGGDPVLASLRESEPDLAPARHYVDDTGSWASNEWAIDYTAPLVSALARVVEDPRPLSAFDPDYDEHPPTDDGGVRTDQVGYLPGAEKVAIVPAEETAAGVELGHGEGDGDGGDGTEDTGGSDEEGGEADDGGGGAGDESDEAEPGVEGGAATDGTAEEGASDDGLPGFGVAGGLVGLAGGLAAGRHLGDRPPGAERDDPAE